MRITCSIFRLADRRCLALPQMVGPVQEDLQGRAKGTMDQKQRIDHDLPVAQHSTLHHACILWNLSVKHTDIHICKFLHDIYLHQPDRHTIRILVQKDT